MKNNIPRKTKKGISQRYKRTSSRSKEKKFSRERSRDKSRNSKSEKLDIYLNDFFNNNNAKYNNNGLYIKITNLSDCGIYSKYENINREKIQGFDENTKSKIKEIISQNCILTQSDKAKILGRKLFDMISIIKKINIKYPFPNLEFNKSLNDDEFMEKVKDSINYICGKMNGDYIEHLRQKLMNCETQIKNLFNNNKIIKDILQNALITLLTNDDNNSDCINEENKNLSLLNINNISACPLVNLPFKYNNKSIDLNKKNIIETATSYIPLSSYHNTMKKFIVNYKLNKDDLKQEITNYINSHQIYFAKLNDDINGLIIHTGDIFINIKYLREYIEEENNNDNSIIIREKIMLIILHELNHGLLRTIGIKNFLINSKRKNEGKTKLRFKGLNENHYYLLEIEESGNNFDFELYCGYYFDQINKNFALFFLNIKNFSKKKDYYNKLKELIKKSPNSCDKINKFKINYKTIMGQCAFNIFRYNIKRKKNKENSNNKIEEDSIQDNINEEEDNENGNEEDSFEDEEKEENSSKEEILNRDGKDEDNY